ncbi:MAG TPA: TolC family protein [Opitutaceae bacterium]|nr:TolC family protein [Opitutaceae bacterium]
MIRTRARLAGLLIATLGLSACATYRAKPLPDQPDLAAVITLPVERLAVPVPVPDRIDPFRPLPEEAVVALAVLNNPDLKAQRLRAGVAAAQVFAAGLLPDPQLAVGLSRSAEHQGFDLGLTEDLAAILTRGARRDAERARARQVNLDVLWQEWQVAARARELFIQVNLDRELRPLLASERSILADRSRREREAMQQGAAAAAAVDADAAALASADARFRSAQLDENDADHALHALLGLRPDVPLRLAPSRSVRLLSRADFDAALAALPRRRADLLALQAGYASGEGDLRAAILGEFPAITVGVDRARSAEEGVRTSGGTVALSLPLFNANRGRIAIARATRAELWQAYQARLDEATVDADRAWRATLLLTRQLHDLQAQLPALARTATATEQAFRAGNLSLESYASLRPEYLAQQAAVIRARAALAQAQSALRVVLGRP